MQHASITCLPCYQSSATLGRLQAALTRAQGEKHTKICAADLHEIDVRLRIVVQVDILYLHNAAEAQLQRLGNEGFEALLSAAFDWLEGARKRGAIQACALCEVGAGLGVMDQIPASVFNIQAQHLLWTDVMWSGQVWAGDLGLLQEAAGSARLPVPGASGGAGGGGGRRGSWL